MTLTRIPSKALPRPRRGALLLLAAAALALGVAGCSGGDGDGNTTTQPGAGCSEDPRVTPYLVGMEAKSSDGAVTVTFLDADPAPPAKGDNVWMLKIEDASGAAVNDATLSTEAFMPDHGHSSTVVPQITFKGDGTYEIAGLDLFMPGVWEITIDIAPPGGTVQSVLFTFCVQG